MQNKLDEIKWWQKRIHNIIFRSNKEFKGFVLRSHLVLPSNCFVVDVCSLGFLLWETKGRISIQTFLFDKQHRKWEQKCAYTSTFQTFFLWFAIHCWRNDFKSKCICCEIVRWQIRTSVSVIWVIPYLDFSWTEQNKHQIAEEVDASRDPEYDAPLIGFRFVGDDVAHQQWSNDRHYVGGRIR